MQSQWRETRGVILTRRPSSNHFRQRQSLVRNCTGGKKISASRTALRDVYPPHVRERRIQGLPGGTFSTVLIQPRPIVERCATNLGHRRPAKMNATTRPGVRCRLCYVPPNFELRQGRCKDFDQADNRGLRRGHFRSVWRGSAGLDAD